jgi:hypothetical protein
MFLYESLNRELAKTIIVNDYDKKSDILTIIKNHFAKDTVLYKEMQIYNSILEKDSMPFRLAERTLTEAKKSYEQLDTGQIFEEQSELIKKINVTLGKAFYSTFVPNYKNIATAYQVFNGELTPKSRVILEDNMMSYMVSAQEQKKNVLQPIDKLTFKIFVDKFNTTYSDNLLNEQRTLLSNYITSFADNGVELKIFLNQEIQRLEEQLNHAIESYNDDLVVERLSRVLTVVEKFKTKTINKQLIEKVLGVQALIGELTENVDKN